MSEFDLLKEKLSNTCRELSELREKVAALTTDVRVLQCTRALAWKWGAGVASALVFALAVADFVWRLLRDGV